MPRSREPDPATPPRRRLAALVLVTAVLAGLAISAALWRSGADGGDDDGGAARAALAQTVSLQARSAPRTPGNGALHWLGGEEGCLKGTAGLARVPCPATVRGQYNVSSLAISPDGRFAYGVSLHSGYEADAAGKRTRDIPGGTVVAFARNRRSGVLRQLKGSAGCIRDRHAPRNDVTVPCTRAGRGLTGARTIVLSPDGRHAYVAALNDRAIAAFKRDRRTGVLRQLRGRDACVGGVPRRGVRECPRAAKGIRGIRWIATSPDGKNLYAAAPAGDSIAAFERDPRTGGLHQLPGESACIEDRLARVKQGCPTGLGLNYPRTIAISPDGLNAYVASDSADSVYGNDPANGDAVSAFSRDPTTGALRQLPGDAACVENTVARPTTGCPTVGRGLLDAYHVTVSPDGRFVYVGSQASRSGALAIFRREPADGRLIQLPGRNGCFGNGEGCRPARGIKGVDSVTISPNGRRVYVTGYFGLTVATFARDPVSGRLTQLRRRAACVKDVDSSEPCSRSVRGLQGPRNVVLSPDVRYAYVPSSVSGTINVFRVGGAP